MIMMVTPMLAGVGVMMASMVLHVSPNKQS